MGGNLGGRGQPGSSLVLGEATRSEGTPSIQPWFGGEVDTHARSHSGKTLPRGCDCGLSVHFPVGSESGQAVEMGEDLASHESMACGVVMSVLPEWKELKRV